MGPSTGSAYGHDLEYPNRWILVRDALTMGPTAGEDTVTPHTQPPADEDADHMLVRTVLARIILAERLAEIGA